MKLTPQDQGKVIAEFTRTTVTKGKKIVLRDEWTVMFPDGVVQTFSTEKQVMVAAKKYFKKHVEQGKVGIGRIEWRT